MGVVAATTHWIRGRTSPIDPTTVAIAQDRVFLSVDFQSPTELKLTRLPASLGWSSFDASATAICGSQLALVCPFVLSWLMAGARCLAAFTRLRSLICSVLPTWSWFPMLRNPVICQRSR